MENRFKKAILPNQFKKTKNKLSWTFQTLMMASLEVTRMDYSLIKTHILSYKKIRVEIKGKYEIFYNQDKEILKLTSDTKQLYLYLSLNPQDFSKNNYNFVDASGVKEFVNTPMLLVVRNKVGIKKTIELIDLVMQKEKLLKTIIERLIDFCDIYPNMSIEELVGKNLI